MEYIIAIILALTVYHFFTRTKPVRYTKEEMNYLIDRRERERNEVNTN